MIQAEKYRILKDGRVLVDYGPITMSIAAKKQGKSYTEASIIGAEKAIETLNSLIKYLDIAKQWIESIDIKNFDEYPYVLQLMMESVKYLNNDEYTPMAAVAGTFSDMVMQAIVENTDADYVVINNGGDIAFYKSEKIYKDEVFKVGVIDDIVKRQIKHILCIKNSSNIKGIATSGFGGRSLTKGVASAVTVMAESGSLADAAATEIANFTYVKSDKIKVCLAEEIDYDTDIKGTTVVKSVGNLKEEEISKSISLGMDKAIELYNKKMIKGAIIFVQGKFDYYPKNDLYFTMIKNDSRRL